MLKRQCQLTTLEDVKMEALHNYIDGNLPTLILVDIFTSQLNGARDRVKQFADELRNDWLEEKRREELEEMAAELEKDAREESNGAEEDEDGEEEDLGDDVDEREGPENSGDVDGDGEQDGDEDGDGEEEEQVEEEGAEDEEEATDDPESPDLRDRPSEFFIDKRRKLNPPAEAS